MPEFLKLTPRTRRCASCWITFQPNPVEEMRYCICIGTGDLLSVIAFGIPAILPRSTVDGMLCAPPTPSAPATPSGLSWINRRGAMGAATTQAIDRTVRPDTHGGCCPGLGRVVMVDIPSPFTRFQEISTQRGCPRSGDLPPLRRAKTRSKWARTRTSGGSCWLGLACDQRKLGVDAWDHETARGWPSKIGIFQRRRSGPPKEEVPRGSTRRQIPTA